MARSIPKKALLWSLLLAALLLRAVVPAGWMIDTSRPDTITLRICNAGTVMTIPLEREGIPAGKDRSAAPCLFAGFADGASLPTAGAFAALHPPASQQRVAHLARLALERPGYERPPGRGPPVRA